MPCLVFTEILLVPKDKSIFSVSVLTGSAKSTLDKGFIDKPIFLVIQGYFENVIKIPFSDMHFPQGALEYQIVSVHYISYTLFQPVFPLVKPTRTKKYFRDSRILISANETNFLIHLFAFYKAIQPTTLSEKK